MSCDQCARLRTSTIRLPSNNGCRTADARISSIAAAIGEPARARMLYRLADGRARTSTELAVVADVSPSTASVHLQRLKAERLVTVLAQGKPGTTASASADVAAALEALSVLAGAPAQTFAPTTPIRLRAARTCYDHIAGTLGVALHDRCVALAGSAGATAGADYDLDRGRAALGELGVDVDAAARTRRALRVRLPRLERAPATSRRRARRRPARARVETPMGGAGPRQPQPRRHRRGRREMRVRFGLHPS